MRKNNRIKQKLTILFVLFSIGNVVAQTDLYVHYVDKSFDKQKSAFVKNELIIKSDSVSFFETRYKMDFSDSICKRLIYMPINKSSEDTFLESLNKDIDANNIFDSKYHELKFDKDQIIFLRRFQIRVNRKDYYLYDIPNDNESEIIGIKNNREKFEQIMKSVELLMIPQQEERLKKNEVLSISEDPYNFFNVIIEQTIQLDKQTESTVLLKINNQGLRTVKYETGLKSREINDTISDIETFKIELKNLVKNENLALCTANPVFRIPDVGQTSGYIQISMIEEPLKYENQNVVYCFSWMINSTNVGNKKSDYISNISKESIKFLESLIK